jgi:membrane protein YqaA with SNARE-associated domain
MTLLQLLAVVGIVFAVNLLPAFGPPTWALIVFVHFQWRDIPTPVLIASAALAATAGRLVLAVGARKFGGRLSAERRASLDALGETLGKSKTGLVASLALFAFSPLPSAQMFMAAGLAGIPLLPLAGAFLIGRSVSYTIYVTAASASEETIHRLLSQGVASPPAIALQVASLAAVILMIRIDWIKVIDWTRARIARVRGRPTPPSVRPAHLDRPSSGETAKPA